MLGRFVKHDEPSRSAHVNKTWMQSANKSITYQMTPAIKIYTSTSPCASVLRHPSHHTTLKHQSFYPSIHYLENRSGSSLITDKMKGKKRKSATRTKRVLLIIIIFKKFLNVSPFLEKVNLCQQE